MSSSIFKKYKQVPEVPHRKYSLGGLGGILVWLWFALPGWGAPMQPTITQVNSKNVVVGITTYINATANVPIKGNAEANKDIKIYDGATLVGTGTTDITGAYTITANLPLGNHSLTAIATDITGDSPPSTTATIAVETTPPTFVTAPRINGSATMNDSYLNYTSSNTVTINIADTGGSDLDFAASTFEVYDWGPAATPYATPLSVSGTLTNNSIDVLTYTLTTPTDLQTEKNKYEVKVTIKDKAGNTSSISRFAYRDTTPPPKPTFRIYDPDHNVFTGTGEPATNTPDVNGYVDYYPSMTIVADQNIAAKRIKFSGNAGTEGGPLNAPPPAGFGVRYVTAYISPSGGPAGSANTLGAGNSLNYATGDYTIAFTQLFTQAAASFYVISYDSVSLNSGVTWFNFTFANAAPPPPPPPTPPGNPSLTGWDTLRLLGPGLEFTDPYTIPLVTGLAQTNAAEQFVCLYNISPTSNWATTDYRVCQAIKPSGQNYVHTVGSYDSGDSWADLDGDFQWDVGEPFNDSSVSLTTPSDGRQFRLENVRNLSFPLIDSSLMYYRVMVLGAPNLYSSTLSAGYSHYHVSPPHLPTFNSLLYTPDNTDLRTTTPTSVMARVSTYGERDCGTTAHGVNTGAAFSAVSILNNLGVDISTPRTTTWTYTGCTWTGSLYKIDYNGVLNTSTMALPNGTYTVKLMVEDFMKQQLLDTSKTFKIDNVPPNPSNIFPGNASTVSSIPSFTADITDPPLADGTPGVGANMDLSLEQINPYKRIGLLATATSTTTLTLNIDTPIGGQALDHRSNALATGGALPPGGAIQVWQNNAAKTIVGLTEGSLASNATLTANGGGTISISMAAGSLTVGESYEVYYLIPHFDSNDGILKIAAVPTMPANAPGTYGTRITGRDKVGNVQTTIPITSIQMDPPVGTITLNGSPVDVYILGSPDAVCTTAGSTTPCTTITSDLIKGTSGTLVPDGTLVTVNLSSAAGVFVQTDANGIAADGFQVATATNGAAAGQIKFQVRSSSVNNFAAVTVGAMVGSASGNVTINMLRPKVTITKAVDVTSRAPSQVITYTITYTNNGNSISNNTTIKDLLPATLLYVPGSTKLNGVVQADGTVFNAGIGPSGEISVNAGSVAVSGTGTVVFQAAVK